MVAQAHRCHVVYEHWTAEEATVTGETPDAAPCAPAWLGLTASVGWTNLVLRHQQGREAPSNLGMESSKSVSSRSVGQTEEARKSKRTITTVLEAPNGGRVDASGASI